jgi:hypothetical protein
MYQYSSNYNNYYNWSYYQQYHQYQPQHQSYFTEKQHTYNHSHSHKSYKSDDYDYDYGFDFAYYDFDNRKEPAKLKLPNCDSKSKQKIKQAKLLSKKPELLVNDEKTQTNEEYKPTYTPESKEKCVNGPSFSTDVADLDQSTWTVNFTTPNRSVVEEKLNLTAEKTSNSIQSAKEQEIRNAIVPIPIPENESEKQIEELNISGILMNSEEIKKWQSKGGNLKKHKLREGPTQIINKKRPQPIEYEQNIIVKYLKPPTPPPVNIILEERPRRIIPAPPLVVRLPRHAPCLSANKTRISNRY